MLHVTSTFQIILSNVMITGAHRLGYSMVLGAGALAKMGDIGC